MEKIAAQKADDKSPLYNVFLEQAIESGYDAPEAQRIAEYQTIYKQQIQNQVGRESLGGILEFDLQDQKATKKQLPKLKNQVGKVFFAPYDGKFKVLTILLADVQRFKCVNGTILGFEVVPDVCSINAISSGRIL